MKLKLLFIVFILFPGLNKTFADCTACWELKGVMIQLNDGRKIDGYILWNVGWPSLFFDSPSPPQANFADSVLACYKRLNSNLVVYKEIRVFKDIFKDLPVAIDNIDTISLPDILFLKPDPKEFDGLKGASDIQVVTESIASWLSKKPVAVYTFDLYGMADAYIVSYNEEYDLERIKEISTTDYNDQIENYKKKNVFFFSFWWD